MKKKRKQMSDHDKKALAFIMIFGSIMYMGGEIAEYQANKPQSVTYREYIDTLEAGQGNKEDLIDTVYYDPDADYWRYTLWNDKSRAKYQEWLDSGKSSADFKYNYSKEDWRVFEMPDLTNDTLQAHVEKYDGTACREIVKKSFQPFWLSAFSLMGETFFLFLFLGGFMLFYSKSMGNIGGLNPKDIQVNDTGVRFKDIIGHDEVIADLQLIVKLMQKKRNETEAEKKLLVDKKAVSKFPVQIPRGMLFSGEAGTGKTLLAKAVAGESGVPFFYMNASGFVEMYVGVGAKRVRQLFKLARKNAPCIIFIDEIDAVGTDRNAATVSGEQKQTINALLQEMDGFDTKSGVFIIAATNNPDKLDKALVRSGRFDRQVIISPPKDWTVRKQLFEHYLQQEINDNMCSANLEQIAKQGVGFTGADVSAVCNEARLIATAKDSDSITTEILEEAIDRKIFKGNHVKEKRSEEINIIAYHEAGHALVNVLLNVPIARATIIGSTGGVGGAVFREEQNKVMQTKKDLLNFVMAAYGGRAAEEVVFGAENVTTGASNDFEKATEILKAYVKTYAFDEKKIVVSDEQSIMQDYVFNRTSQLADELYDKTVAMVSEHTDKLEKIAQLLLEKETVSGEEIYQLVK